MKNQQNKITAQQSESTDREWILGNATFFELDKEERIESMFRAYNKNRRQSCLAAAPISHATTIRWIIASNRNSDYEFWELAIEFNE